jgi:hypothetical protein
MARIRQFRMLQLFVTVIVMLQLIAAQVMAASGELHCKLHDHADDAEHQCVVTMMLSGGYDSVAPGIVPVEFVPEPPPWVANVPHVADSVPAHLVGGVMAHAPPRGP